MPDQRESATTLPVLRSLVAPVMLGLIPFVIFLVMVKHGVITNEFVLRYCAGHEVSYITTGMFFVGLAALALKSFDVLRQSLSLNQIQLEDIPPGGQPASSCGSLLDHLEMLPKLARNSYLGRRLHDAVSHVDRKQSADNLDDELKYLADQDADRQHEGFSLVRILIWATPMLGFLGTVIGITLALENFGKQDFGNDNLQGAMDVLLGGLYLAFDTTALALSCSVVLMFIQFFVDRFETQLLSTVDERVNEELVGRFQETDPRIEDSPVKTIERMGESVITSSRELVEQQAKIWQNSFDRAQEKWQTMTEGSGAHLQESLTKAIDLALQKHAERMGEVEQSAAKQLRRRWEQWQVALSENARVLHAQQKELAKHGEILTQVVDATGDVVKLEQALNHNLQALAGSKNFEDTVMSLSAAIHLLNSRLTELPVKNKVELSDPQDRAA